MKVAVIGAGSTYTPELVSGLSRERDRIDVSELALHDIDAERREVVGGMAARMLERQAFGGDLLVTDDLDRAVDGADFVLVQIRVGGQAARLSDETIPHACGCIGQETTGAGGLAKALRTVPVVLDIAERVRASARHRARGSSISRTRSESSPAPCSTPVIAASACATWRSDSSAAWRRCWASRPSSSRSTRSASTTSPGSAPFASPARTSSRRCSRERGDELAAEVALPRQLLEELGAIPSYYLRYFYAHDAVLAEQLDGTPRAAVVAEIEQHLLELYRDPEVDEKPPLLEQRGGAFYSEAATGLVARSPPAPASCTRSTSGTTARSRVSPTTMSSRCRRGSRTACPSRCRRRRSRPSCSGSRSTSRRTSGSPSRAALSGDPADVRKALLAHPLVGQWGATEELVERLLAADEAHLPRFAARRDASR